MGLPPDLPLDPARVETLLEQQGQVVVYFSLSLLLAPAVETLVLLDRMIYLQENGKTGPHHTSGTLSSRAVFQDLNSCLSLGVASQLVPLFDPYISPRNFVLVALKASG